MVTKYDVFEFIYSKGSIIQPKEVATYFKKLDKDYKFIYRLMMDLAEMKQVSKSEHGFEVIRNKKNDLLYQMIQFCVSNKINYNELLNENITAFISKGFLKKNFGINDFDIHPRTYSKYVNILAKNGLLIIVSRKPLICVIPYNSFLKNLVVYFGHKVLVVKHKENEYFSEIERELKKFNRLKDRNAIVYRKIIDEFEISFIHHSLTLEGNPITLPDTIKLLRDYIVPKNLSVESIEEVKNYQKAMQKMLQDALNNMPLTKNVITNYHYLAMQHRDDIAGKIRDFPVYIKGNPYFKVAKAEEIEPKLNILIKKYNEFRVKKNALTKILDFVAYFHNEFQQIHPFEDGNSRTTRLITFHLLRTQGVPIFDIPLGLLEQYLDSTKGARKRNDNNLNQVLQLIILYNLKTINERLS
ncbi:MAG: Fic family protein [Candidatus Methanofastidiosia archaeon]